MNRVWFFTLLAFLLLGGGSAGAADDALSVRDRVWILSKTYQAITVYFAHWETAAYTPAQADSVYELFLDRAVAARGRSEFTRLMQEYTGLLRNGHSSYVDFTEYQIKKPLGFEWKYRFGNDHWVVTRSLIDGLTAGDIVDSINGRSIEDLYKSLSYLTPGSSDRSRRTSFGDWTLSSYLDSTYTLSIRDWHDRRQRLTVDRSMLPKDSVPAHSTGRWIEEPKTAYIRIPLFAAGNFQDEALSLLDTFWTAECIIIDLRGNPGGNSPTELLSKLMNRPYRNGEESTPLSIALFRSMAENNGPWWDKFRRSRMSWSSAFTCACDEAYPGRVILLVDRQTGSAAEDFAMSFRDNGRAEIIGETTTGSTGQPYHFIFRDIGMISIGALEVSMPDGSPFEGVGIKPDIEVVIIRDDLYKGIDRNLERAVIEASRP